MDYCSLAYVRSLHGPFKYDAECNVDWSRACIFSWVTSFSLPAQIPLERFPFLSQYPK